jgi:outer membrane protein assembly factor BamB
MRELRQVLLALSPRAHAAEGEEVMMPFTRSIKPEAAGFLAATCRGVAVVAGIFCVAVATILIANYLQMSSVKPLESPALAAMREQYRSAPDDELAGQIRALDLAARRAFFTRQWQNRTAAILLIAGAALLVACLRAATSLSKRLPKPLPGEGEKLRPAPRAARIALMATGLVLLAGSLAAAVLVDRLLPADPAAAARSVARVGRGTGFGSTAVGPELWANWPQFRGPGGNGIAGPQDPPIDWDGASGKNIAWKTEVPLPGKNSPVVWNDRVFLSGADTSNREIYCWDAATGALRWRTPIPGAGVLLKASRISADTGFARATSPPSTSTGRSSGAGSSACPISTTATARRSPCSATFSWSSSTNTRAAG